MPAQPFVDWLSARIARHRGTVPVWLSPEYRDKQAAAMLARELGWDNNDAGTRRLHRLRHGVRPTSRNGIKLDLPSDSLPADVVEDALHRLGLRLIDVYGPYADRMAGTTGRPWLVLRYIDLMESVARARAVEGSPLLPERYCSGCGLVAPFDSGVYGSVCVWCLGRREFAARERERERRRAA